MKPLAQRCRDGGKYQRCHSPPKRRKVSRFFRDTFCVVHVEWCVIVYWLLTVQPEGMPFTPDVQFDIDVALVNVPVAETP